MPKRLFRLGGVYAGSILLLIALLFASPARAQRGAITRPQNIAELTEEAAVVIRGTVVRAQVEPHPQYRRLTTVVVTLQVKETLKGSTGETYTFRQYVWDVRDRRSGLDYRKGQQVLLLLTAPSALGLSSPVGLEQGRFRIERDAQGREYAANGHGNAGLLRGLDRAAEQKGIPLSGPQARLVTQHRSGAISLDELRGLIRQFAGGRP